ncbi:acyl carrier protein [Paraburkholderia rhizosphaerae]|uniref:Acyl carrier protein n=1 Tax=Paraburkholderia rhizosphaerae TaxID=480658 RepID=A0A4R8LT46_9BURK|nr:acyl carrier protein [Paraburkholderia rhizosphaerae]TDY50853.1 acyl carrier protein [Paraburkholderia rhizosphaerae]
MSQQNVLEKVQYLIAEALDLKPAEIHAEQSFRGDLRADSLDSVEIIMSIEEAFGVEFDEDSAAKVETVGDVVAYIERALAQKHAVSA